MRQLHVSLQPKPCSLSLAALYVHGYRIEVDQPASPKDIATVEKAYRNLDFF